MFFDAEKNWNMKTKAIFYHAGCPVCVAAEQNIAQALDRNRYEVEVVHLGTDKSRMAEAERAGVKSVPALVLDGQAYHINYGADLSALKS
jgi:glutaredoxin